MRPLATLLLLAAAAGGAAARTHGHSAGALAPEADSIELPAGPAPRFASAEAHAAHEELAAVLAAPAAGAAPNASAAAAADPYSAACLHVPFAVCVGSPEDGAGVSVLTGTQPPKGLVGAWDFDAVGAQDASGLLNALVPAPLPAPGFLGGSGALLDGKRVPTLRHRPEYDSASLSAGFWLFLLRDSFGGFQTLFHKGRREGDTTVAAPAVQLWPDSRRLHVSVSTSPRHKASVDSRGAVPLRRWTHVQVVLDGRILQVYLNGILDTEYLLPAPVVPNEDPIYVGNDPWLGNGPVAYLDDLRLYRRGLTPDEVHAAAAAAFPGVNSRAVRQGCAACPFAEARTSCPEFHHLCRADELHAGALSVARTMGWVPNLGDPATVVWRGDDTAPAEGDGAAVCCRDEAEL